ncbi:MAG TPA: M50 family metallopeptidase [Myxococcaceae bacterium]|nr:M50 family metallopeptidase [Myxococcaceae bacterium]
MPDPLRPRSGLDAGRLVVLAVLVMAGLWFWSAPWLAPLRLLVVLVHETGHALATLLFGGRVERVIVGADESGQCLSSLPAGWLPQIAVYSAGYLGSAVSGALQLVLAFRFRLHRPVLYAMGVWVTAMGLIYAGNAFTVGYCLVMGAVLLVLARALPGAAVRALVMVIAAFTGLYALFDLRDDLWRPGGGGPSDAVLLASQTHVPALIWSLLWSVASLAVLALAAAISLRRAAPEPMDALEAVRSAAASGMQRTTPNP